jgi:hypothetical protein
MGVPFECNLCSFRNVVGRDPDDTDARDEFTLTAIRRVLLDVMWAREPDTVASNWSRSRREFDMAVSNLSLNYHTLLPVLGKNPLVGDRVGLGVALTTALASLRPGKNAAYVQFDTIRKTQTWYANAYDAGEIFSARRWWVWTRRSSTSLRDIPSGNGSHVSCGAHVCAWAWFEGRTRH